MEWRRERLPTPVFWPGEFHGLHSPWGRSRTQLSNFQFHNLTLLSTSTAPILGQSSGTFTVVFTDLSSYFHCIPLLP